MAKLHRQARLALILLVFAGCARWGAARYENQMKAQERQMEFLSSQFSGVRGKGQSVLLTPSRGCRLAFQDDHSPQEPRLLRVGSQFGAPDDDVGSSYTITSIRPEGVGIHFDISGYLGGDYISDSGDITVPWK